MEWLDKVQNLCMNIIGQALHWPDMEEICAQFNIKDRLHRTRNISTRNTTLYQSFTAFNTICHK